MKPLFFMSWLLLTLPASALPLRGSEPLSPPAGSAPPPVLPTVHFSEARRDALDFYPKAEATWGDVLNPYGVMPDEGYRVWYFDTRQPGTVVEHGTTPYIAARYGSKQRETPGRLEHEHFGAYWAGRLRVPQAGLYRIAGKLDLERGYEMRVLINKRVLPFFLLGEGLVLHLPAGEHLLEVEFASRHHFLDFRLSAAPLVTELDNEALRLAVDALKLPPETVVYAVSVEGSAAVDNTLAVQSPPGETPYILLLSSYPYDPTNWEIRGRAPQLVIYNHAGSGSVVATTAPVLAWQRGIGGVLTRQQNPKCDCLSDGILRCHDEPHDLAGLMTTVREITGFPLAGVSQSMDDISRITVPELPVDGGTLAALKPSAQAIARKQQECVQLNERRLGILRPENP